MYMTKSHSALRRKREMPPNIALEARRGYVAAIRGFSRVWDDSVIEVVLAWAAARLNSAVREQE